MNSTSQGELVLSVVGGTPEDARKDGHIIRARCAPLSPASGFPVSWSQQVIHEISGLELTTGVTKLQALRVLPDSGEVIFSTDHNDIANTKRIRNLFLFPPSQPE